MPQWTEYLFPALRLVAAIIGLAWIIYSLAKIFNDSTTHTNADRFLGTKGLVVESIDNLQGVGAVRLEGLVWSARSESGSSIPNGSVVRVLRMEGVKVYVEEISEGVQAS